MSLTVDLIILAIIAVTVLLSAKRGFVCIFVETAGFLAALWVALTFNTPMAEVTYDNMIEPKVISAITQETENTAEQTAGSMWEALPALVKTGMTTLGINEESFDQNILENLGQGDESAAKNASQNLVRPAVVKLLALIYALMLLAVLSFVVKIVARLINRLISFKLAAKINRFLGGIIGIPKGIVLAVLVCLILSLLVSFRPAGIWIFTPETLKSSWFFSHLSLQKLPF